VSVTNTAVTVATTATPILATDPTRRQATFHNPNATVIYVGGPGVTTTNGLPVNQNVTLQLTQPHREDTTVQQAWYGIVAAGTQVIRVVEVDN
jgi:hypothetical protein